MLKRFIILNKYVPDALTPPLPPLRRQIQRGYGRERLAKICAGGVFGELGFYLLTPQPFRVLARENCHLHTLDRDDMAKMQVAINA